MEEKEVFERSKKLVRSPEGKGKMEGILRKLEKIDGRIKEECGKVGERVDCLREEGKKEREELRKMWEEEKKEMNARLKGLEKRLNKREVVRVEKEQGISSGGGEQRLEKETEKRITKIEQSLERKEREARRKNIIVEGVGMEVGEVWEREIQRVWEKIGVVGGRKIMRKIGAVGKEGKRAGFN